MCSQLYLTLPTLYCLVVYVLYSWLGLTGIQTVLFVASKGSEHFLNKKKDGTKQKQGLYVLVSFKILSNICCVAIPKFLKISREKNMHPWFLGAFIPNQSVINI